MSSRVEVEIETNEGGDLALNALRDALAVLPTDQFNITIKRVVVIRPSDAREQVEQTQQRLVRYIIIGRDIEACRKYAKKHQRMLLGAHVSLITTTEPDRMRGLQGLVIFVPGWQIGLTFDQTNEIRTNAEICSRR